VIEPGRTGAYLALFGELGSALLVTTLVGVLGGHWLDEQLRMALPVFAIVGFFLGAGSGTVMIYRLVSRFLRTLD
jgi:F0F1-type ATP synthase assembly protein I